VSEFQGFRVLSFQGFKVSRFKGSSFLGSELRGSEVSIRRNRRFKVSRKPNSMTQLAFPTWNPKVPGLNPR
jgi:hypothetical protein